MAAGGGEYELVHVDLAPIGTPGEQLLDHIERQLRFSLAGLRLRLLDDQPLVMDVDRSPPELTELGYAQSRLSHDRDHQSPTDTAIETAISIHLPRDGEHLVELIGLEHPS